MEYNRTNRLEKSLAMSGVSSFIYQPNRITNAHYNFTLIQERIMNAIIYSLQEAIKLRMHGCDYRQLDLFKDMSNDIVLEIPLKFIASKQQYPIVRETCRMLAGLVVEIPYTDKNKNKQRIRYSGLFRADVPLNGERSSTIRIEMDRKVAALIIEVDLIDNKKAINYTKYRFYITRNARRKFTPRIYKLICSYRSRGRFTISVEDLKKMLGIENCYKYYRDFKKYVLLPAQKELIHLGADCWFDCEQSDFESRTNNIVTHINFTVYSIEFNNRLESGRHNVKWTLKSGFNFTEKDMEEVEELINNNNPILMIEKINYLYTFMRLNKKVQYPRRFVIASLKKEFNSSHPLSSNK